VKATTLPRSSANPMGLTVTTLLLPAHWRGYFERGDAHSLNAKEEMLVTTIENLFGVCVGCHDDGVRYCVDHDASANGIEPAYCTQFTFHNTPEEV